MDFTHTPTMTSASAVVFLLVGTLLVPEPYHKDSTIYMIYHLINKGRMGLTQCNGPGYICEQVTALSPRHMWSLHVEAVLKHTQPHVHGKPWLSGLEYKLITI